MNEKISVEQLKELLLTYGYTYTTTFELSYHVFQSKEYKLIYTFSGYLRITRDRKFGYYAGIIQHLRLETVDEIKFILDRLL